jgi:hypothetical protein
VYAAKRMDTVSTEGPPHRMTAGCKYKNKLKIRNGEEKYKIRNNLKTYITPTKKQ